jgi:hypothetical protein
MPLTVRAYIAAQWRSVLKLKMFTWAACGALGCERSYFHFSKSLPVRSRHIA